MNGYLLMLPIFAETTEIVGILSFAGNLAGIVIVVWMMLKRDKEREDKQADQDIQRDAESKKHAAFMFERLEISEKQSRDHVERVVSYTSEVVREAQSKLSTLTREHMTVTKEAIRTLTELRSAQESMHKEIGQVRNKVEEQSSVLRTCHELIKKNVDQSGD